MVGAIVGFAVASGKRYRKARELRDAALDQLQVQYNAKLAALEKNTKIANS
jgi:hypothetical protein